MSQELHVIFGTGPVGCWTARALQHQNIRIRAVNRTGRRPDLMPVGVEIIAADVADASQAKKAADGASVIYQAANPPYHLWLQNFPGIQAGALAAARSTAARYVSIENLYMYDGRGILTENSPVAPRSRKGVLRARMADDVMHEHREGRIQAIALRSSDYYGPGVLGSSFGERFFRPMVQGKRGQIAGSTDRPHSYAYIEDVGRAAAILGTQAEALGRVWISPHAPAWTQGQMVAAAAAALRVQPRWTAISPFMMNLAGLFVPGARASVEMMYQFTEDFVVDSSRFQKTFGLEPTPIEEGIRRTASWFRLQAAS